MVTISRIIPTLPKDEPMKLIPQTVSALLSKIESSLTSSFLKKKYIK